MQCLIHADSSPSAYIPAMADIFLLSLSDSLKVLLLVKVSLFLIIQFVMLDV